MFEVDEVFSARGTKVSAGRVIYSTTRSQATGYVTDYNDLLTN